MGEGGREGWVSWAMLHPWPPSQEGHQQMAKMGWPGVKRMGQVNTRSVQEIQKSLMSQHPSVGGHARLSG